MSLSLKYDVVSVQCFIFLTNKFIFYCQLKKTIQSFLLMNYLKLRLIFYNLPEHYGQYTTLRIDKSNVPLLIISYSCEIYFSIELKCPQIAAKRIFQPLISHMRKQKWDHRNPHRVQLQWVLQT